MNILPAMPAMPANRQRFLLCLWGAAILLVGGFARADIVVKSATGTDLFHGASWSGSVPAAADVAAWNTNSLGAGLTLQSALSWSGISVIDALSDIDVAGAGAIQLGANGVDMSASVVNMSLANAIVLGANQTWNVNANAALVVSGAISGSCRLVKNGLGNLTLSGNNPITGVTTVNGGTLVISGQLHWNENWQHLPALTVNVGGTVKVSSGNAGNFLGQCNFEATNNTIAGGILQFDTAGGTAESIERAFAIGTNGGTIAVLNRNATLTFDYFSDPMQFSVPAAASLTLSGEGNGVMNKNLSGYGGLIKSGSGTWTMNGANNYAGPTIVSNGTLVVNGSLWNGPLTVMAGATLGGPGGILGNLTFLAGAQAQFAIGTVAHWSGRVTLNNNPVHLTLTSQVPPGSYVLATYNASGSTGSFNHIPVLDSGSLTNGCTAQIKTDRGQVSLIVRPPPAPQLAILAVNGGSNAVAGLGFSVMVQAQDTNGNPLAVPANTPVILSLDSGYGMLAGNLAGTIPAGSSSTIMGGVTYSLDEGDVVITATDASGNLLHGNSNPFTVNLGPPTTITLTSDGDWSAAPETTLPSSFVVTVTDAGGNPVAGAGVTFAVVTTPAGATGQALSLTHALTGTDGKAASSLTLGDKLGGYTVTASLTGLNINPVFITATAVNRGWTQVWSDEFNYDGLPDSNKWNYENGFVRNGESQYYTTNRIQNACVTNGTLIITARQEEYVPPGQFSPVADYTSASLITLGKASWTYGRMEMRAKMPLPYGGVWTAFWMQGTNFPMVGWPVCGEIDIAEYVSWNPNPHGNAFWGYNGGTVGNGQFFSTPASYADFHIYAMEWSPAQINFFYDTTNYYTIYVDEAGQGPANPFRNPQYLMLNFALGGAYGGTIYDAGLPQQYLIDYVRVYQQIPTWTGSAGDGLWGSADNWTNSLPPASGDGVVFAGGTNLNSLVNSACSQAGVTFYETAGSYVIGATNGGMLVLTTNGISNYSLNGQTFNMPLVLAADQPFNTDPGGLILSGVISGDGFGLVKTGGGTLTLLGANTYSGRTTIGAGTLALGAGGSWLTSGINLAAGATLDVSALGDFTFGSNVPLVASGDGVILGVSAACLNGGVTNLICMNANPINLLYAGAGPALYVSQGTLSLAGNVFTINTATGTSLPPGTYPVVLQAAGNIRSSGSFPPVSGNAIGLGQTGHLVVTRNTVNLVVTTAAMMSISIPVMSGERTVQLNFTGINPNLSYRVQVNDSLATTNWATLFTNVTGTNGLATVIDAAATTNAQRFYRLVTP